MLDHHPPIAVENAEPVSPFDDPDFLYLAMPEAMRTYAAPVLPDWRENANGLDALAQLLNQLKSGGNSSVDLAIYDPQTRQFIGQILGEGEISVLADKPGKRLIVNESVFAGVWRIRQFEAGELFKDYLETGAFPNILGDWASAQEETMSLPSTYPDNLMNAPALLYEIFTKSTEFADGREEVINLTLLPLTLEDMNYLIEQLGLAGISILSKGYGDCRIRRTALPNVWWVQYFNSPGQLILNTLEITRLPQVVMAAAEDLEDSAIRLTELLGGLA